MFAQTSINFFESFAGVWGAFLKAPPANPLASLRILLDNCKKTGYNIHEYVERSRGITPKGITVRKVRASQGRIADNVSRRRLPGKCNRNRPPRAIHAVRMERRGKSPPTLMVT